MIDENIRTYLKSAPTPALYCALLKPGSSFQMSSGLLLSPTPSSPSVDASKADNSLQGSNSNSNSNSNRECEGEGDREGEGEGDRDREV